MRKLIVLVGLVLGVVTLAGCESKDSLEELGLAGLTAKEILVQVAEGTIAVDGFGLSVYDDELVIYNDEMTVSLDMPDDEFYLSVAPYVNDTHTCLYHSATGCRGEMKSETFYVEFIDNEGNVLLSQEMNSLSNGFIDMWLPRYVEGTLTITFDEMVVTKVISTYGGEPTCETTMQLQ